MKYAKGITLLEIVICVLVIGIGILFFAIATHKDGTYQPTTEVQTKKATSTQ